MGLGSGSDLSIIRGKASPGHFPSSGRTFRENLNDAMSIVPLNRSGYFAEKSTRKVTATNVRVYESANPLQDSYDFQSAAGKGFASYKQLGSKGHILTMADGTRIVFRYKSSSDGSPVVELTIRGLNRVKSQKIHFVQRSDDAKRI